MYQKMSPITTIIIGLHSCVYSRLEVAPLGLVAAAGCFEQYQFANVLCSGDCEVVFLRRVELKAAVRHDPINP